MESTKEQHGFLHQILPPRLEDAGLEDCALPPESIHQAFLKAASAVKSRAAAIFSDDDEYTGGCISNPWPDISSDTVIGIQPENELPEACGVEKGCDAGGDEVIVVEGSCGAGGVVEEQEDIVVVGEGGEKLGEGGKSCVDEAGLKIEEDAKKKNGFGDEEEKEKKPTLAEGYV